MKKQDQEHSIAWQINHDLKVQNKVILGLLGLSIITNILVLLIKY